MNNPNDVITRLKRCEELCKEIEKLLKPEKSPKASIWIEMLHLEVSKILRDRLQQNEEN